MRHIPNLICLFRIALIVPLVIAMREEQHQRIIVLFVLASVSDGLDGYLAKRFGWTSDLGRFLDPLADKLLLVTVFLTLVWIGLVPLWLAITVVVRDVVIVGGAIAYRVLVGYVEGHPTPVSKLNTLMQLSFVLAVIAAAAWRNVPRPLVVAIGAATFATTVVSGIDYVLTYAREAIRATRVAPRAAR